MCIYRFKKVEGPDHALTVSILDVASNDEGETNTSLNTRYIVQLAPAIFYLLEIQSCR